MPLKAKTDKKIKTSAVKTAKKGRHKTSAKKKSAQAARSDIFKENKINVVSGNQSEKSSHLVNLRNPNQELDSKKPLFEASWPKPRKISPKLYPVKSPKTAFKKTKIGVNFISAGKSASPFKLSFKPDISESDKKSVEDEEIEDIFAKPKYRQFFNLYIPRNWHKQIAVFIAAAIILILPLQAFTYYQDLQDTKDRILLATSEAIENLKLGQQAAIEFNLDDAGQQFGQARNNFAGAADEINALNILTAEILKLLPGEGKSVAAGLNLLAAGEIIAETGQILIKAGQDLMAKNDLPDYYQSLVNLQPDLKLAIEKFNQAEEKIKQIKSTDLPAEHRETFEKVQGYLPTIKAGLVSLYDINNALLKILGQNQWQRYLLVFLNNNELRGGGGFMGSFALVDIDRGEIKNLEIPGGGTYDVQGQLVPKVISPEPLHLINPRWEFQDANWWPDFPTTAKKIQWFYQNAGGPSVDGVIVVTSTFMERLLEIFGPIEMPDYGREINSENFVAETQKIVELEYDKEENRPKQFIADLAPKLLEKIFGAEKDQLKGMLEVLRQSLNEKQFLVYFNDPQLEGIVSDFGWSGELKKTDGDYIAVIHSNIAGGKTDGVIKEIIEHQAEIQPDGSIVNTVKLTRRHTGIAGENIFTGVQNNSYVRFYVPLGSTLLAASGFKKPPANLFKQLEPDYQPDLDLISIETDRTKDEVTGTDIYKEGGKTVFANWLQLKPGEIQEAVIRYRLPFKLALEGQNTFYYSLLAQKQSGSLGSELKSYLKLNDTLKPLAKFPAEIASDEQGVSFNAFLKTDQFYGVVLIND